MRSVCLCRAGNMSNSFPYHRILWFLVDSEIEQVCRRFLSIFKSAPFTSPSNSLSVHKNNKRNSGWILTEFGI